MSGTIAVLGHVPPIMTEHGATRIRFGAFEADLDQQKLTRNGEPVELQRKGFLVLACLLRRAGETVTRAEIIREVWRDVFVQEDQGLNAAMRKVRKALGDDAMSPIYVRTLGSLGYKFIYPVESAEDDLETGTDG